MQCAETAPLFLMGRGRLLVGAGALLLSVLAAPAFAQGPPATEKKSDPAPKAKGLEDRIYNYWQFAAEQPTPDADKIKSDMKKLEEELQKKTVEAQQIRAQLELLRAKTKTDEAAKAQAKSTGETLHLMLTDPDQKSGEPQEITLQKIDGAWRVVEGKDKKPKTLRVESDGSGGVRVIEAPPGARFGTPPTGPMPPGPGGFGGGIRVAPPAAPTPPAPAALPMRPGEAGGPPMGPGLGGPLGGAGGAGIGGGGRFGGIGGMRPGGGETDNRIDNLEKKLDKMMQLLEQMRKELDGGRGKKAGGSPEEAIQSGTQKEEAAVLKAIHEENKRAEAVTKELQRVESLKRVIEDSLKKERKPETPR